MRRRRAKKIFRDAIVVGNLATADFNPHIVTAARGDDREAFAGEGRLRRELVLDGAELVERVEHVLRKQLRDDAVDGVERQAFARELDLARGRDNVRLVARVHDKGFAVDADNRLEERRYKAHRHMHISASRPRFIRRAVTRAGVSRTRKP